jgi:hypothetical protein
VLGEPATGSYAVDWTDHETWSRPPRKPRTEQPEPATDNTDDGDGDGDGDGDQHCADREASFGHRRGNQGGQKDEAFYGYYLQAATTVKDEHGPRVPELARRMLLSSCHIDPPAAIVPVLERMTADNIKITDVLADSGYAYRVPATWALRIRSLGANLVQDLHPNDRGPNGTHMGATCSNGRLYCPATPAALLDIQPLPRAATPEQTASHDRQCDELARYKLSPISRHDTDGYHRVICPAVQGKIRCPLRPASITLPHDRPTIQHPPKHPPVCCQQQTITVPASVNAKTVQKHDYPSPQHRVSYNRRSAAERTFATVKDPATNNLNKGWCRLTGLTAIALLTATVLIARNIRIHDAHTNRHAEQQHRATNGLPPRQRKRRRHSAHELIAAANTPP